VLGGGVGWGFGCLRWREGGEGQKENGQYIAD